MRLDRARERICEQRAVRREHGMLDDAATRKRDLAAELVRVRIVQRQPRVRVLVRDDQQVATRRIDAAVEIPVRLDDQFAADRDPEGVARLVRREHQLVVEPLHREVLGRAFVRCHVLELAGCDAADVDVAVAALLADSLDGNARSVCRDRLDAAVASDLEHALLAATQIAGPRCRSRHRCGGSSNTRERRRRPAASGE